MTLSTLLDNFAKGITWNALFFVFYKVATTGLTFCLFYALTEADFATWANTNSLIFLLLLWLDCGLRKSIPRYAPILAQKYSGYGTFIGGLVVFQLILLGCALPIFVASAQWLATLFQLPIQKSFIHLVSLIFFTEGCVALLRLLFHAHFWIKQFNTLSMILVGSEVIIDLFLMYGLKLSNETLLTSIFLTKSIASILLVVWGSYRFFRLYTALTHTTQSTKNRIGSVMPEFVMHSVILGGYTNIKSLSERNFLMPFFTLTMGASPAASFKLANDAALLFHRAILKTIGTTDTALLTHAQLLSNKKESLKAAFLRLNNQLRWLSFPLLALVALLFFVQKHLFLQQETTYAFFVMVVGYLLEALLSPYERLLEVQRKYRTIALAYIPYCSALLYVFTHTRNLHLLSILAIFHGTRFFGAWALACVVRRKETRKVL